MVLQSLRDRCNAILAFSSTSPIAPILTALEQLLQQTEDWEKYADRAHSINANRSSIINQIVEWRRFELTCWSRLLHAVEDKFEEPVAHWWFRFYETTIRSAPGLEEAVEGDKEEKVDTENSSYWAELVKLLDSFFTTCSIGQFSARLNLVLSFGRYALDLSVAGKSSEVSFSFLSLSRDVIELTLHSLLLGLWCCRSRFSRKSVQDPPQRSRFLLSILDQSQFVPHERTFSSRKGRSEPHQARELEGHQRLRPSSECRSFASPTLQIGSKIASDSAKTCE